MKKRPALHGTLNNPRVAIRFAFCAIVGPLVLHAFALGSGGIAQGQRTLAPQSRQLSLADRVAYQRAVEEVYWRHRIWPKERPDPKPSFDEAMPPAQLKHKVLDYLRDSQALEDYWQRPVLAEQLQAEMERMAQHTAQPEVLRELFAALGSNPLVIAECLARPTLSQHLLASLSAQDPRGKAAFDSWQSRVKNRMPDGIIAPAADYALPAISDNRLPKNVRATTNSPNGPTPTPACADAWTATSTTNAPLARGFHTAVWTGSEMIVWGGSSNGFPEEINTGGRYNPSTDSWDATSTVNAPSARKDHTAIWTGSEMIIWGGSSAGNELNTGGRYNSSTDSWTAISTINAPAGRDGHTAVWTGSEMIVWGGFSGNYLNTGGRYDPGVDSWTATTTTNTPAARSGHTAVWTGSEMIVWAGVSNFSFVNTGAKYNPVPNSWTATTTTNAPAQRGNHTATWTGSEMIVWAGNDNLTSFLNTGGRYSPVVDSWTPTSTTNPPTARAQATAVWTDSEVVVWGGAHPGKYLNTGGRYCPQAPGPTPATPTPSPTPPFPTPTPTASPATTSTPTPAPSASPTPSALPHALGNISTRLRVEAGENVLIGGFIVTGTQSKRVIVRAIGPSLALLGTLADPALELRDSSGNLIASNDNWHSDHAAEIIATGIPPTDDLESAIVATLPANNSAYTAIVSGANNGTGIGLVEAYDLDQTVDSKLANISTRGLVQTDNNVLIAGTIIRGQPSQRVLLRAIGPSLPVAGKLADPTLELRDGNGALIGSNDNWRSDQQAEIIATGIPPTNDLESALIEILPANGAAYTVIVSGVGGTTGVALVEIYGLN